jgi:predicted transposase/invertase (TIGR01784 family)
MNLAPAYDKWLEETLEQGREEGLTIGRDEGLAIGRDKGREESTIEIAQRMLQINLPFETIAQVTGLSIEVLQRLRSKD